MRCCIWFCWRVRFKKKGTWQCAKNEPLILQADRLQLTRLEKARLTPHARSLQRHRMNVLPSVQKTWIPSYKTMVSEGRITMITISMRPARDAALSSIPMHPLLLPPSTFTASTRLPLKYFFYRPPPLNFLFVSSTTIFTIRPKTDTF
jgi:hypothetical protein